MNSVYYASIFSDTAMAFVNIKPGDRIGGKMNFSVTDLKRKHWLVFFDKRTRSPIAKISIDNAQRDLKSKGKKKKKRRKKD